MSQYTAQTILPASFFDIKVEWPEDWSGDYKDDADHKQWYYARKAQALLVLMRGIPRRRRIRRWVKEVRFLESLEEVDSCACPRLAQCLQQEYWEHILYFKRVLGVTDLEAGKNLSEQQKRLAVYTAKPHKNSAQLATVRPTKS